MTQKEEIISYVEVLLVGFTEHEVSRITRVLQEVLPDEREGEHIINVRDLAADMTDEWFERAYGKYPESEIYEFEDTKDGSISKHLKDPYSEIFYAKLDEI